MDRYEELHSPHGQLSDGASPTGTLAALNAQCRALAAHGKELDEAIAAGVRASDAADQVLAKLDSAESWGVWDLLGGGLLQTFVKHSYLDEAQARAEDLQKALRRFRTELADVTMEADLQLGMDEFLRFADFFLDGFFVDWEVQKEIHDAQTRVQTVKKEIETVLATLRGRKADTERQLAALKQEQEATIRRAGSTPKQQG